VAEVAGSMTPAVSVEERPPYDSPEVLPAGRVRFRLWAPLAREVTVSGTFRYYARGPWPEQVPEAFPLVKDGHGLWSYESDPLEPGLYHYGFRVDGVPLVDPQNPHSRPLGLGSSRSYLDVPGPPGEPAIHQMRPGLARGVTHLETLHSHVLGREVGCWVYTPPGYDPAGSGAGQGGPGAADYPVLYLLHGRGDDERGWYHDGRAAVVLDTLIGTGAIRPVVVAMPYGQLTGPPSEGAPGRRPPAAPSVHPIDAPATRAPGPPSTAAAPPAPSAPNPREAEYFLDEVAGTVESRYRVRRDPAGRALAGLSMGGGQSLRIMISHPGLVGAVGGFSAALLGGGGGGEVDRDALGRALAPLRLLYLCRGHLESERLIPSFDRMVAAVEALAPAVPTLTLHTEIKRGGHEWQVWIRCLAEFLRLWQPA
jgi:enterochelin esterase-like enzyme